MNYIVVTGAAGFIGSCLLQKLYDSGYHNLVAVDDFSKIEKKCNIEHKTYAEKVSRTEFFFMVGSQSRYGGFYTSSRRSHRYYREKLGVVG